MRRPICTRDYIDQNLEFSNSHTIANPVFISPVSRQWLALKWYETFFIAEHKLSPTRREYFGAAAGIALERGKLLKRQTKNRGIRFIKGRRRHGLFNSVCSGRRIRRFLPKRIEGYSARMREPKGKVQLVLLDLKATNTDLRSIASEKSSSIVNGFKERVLCSLDNVKS